MKKLLAGCVGGVLTSMLVACGPKHATHGIAHVQKTTVVTGGPRRLFVVGDSIAFGQGASDPRNGFAFVLFKKLAEAHPGSTIVNHAIGGARLADVTRLEFRNAPATADIVIVEAGANDVVRGNSPAVVTRDATKLLALIRARYPRAKLIVCGIPDLSISPIFVGANRRAIASLSKRDDLALRRVAKRRSASFVDIHALSHAARKNPDAFLAADDFHPSDTGHNAIAALIEKTLN